MWQNEAISTAERHVSIPITGRWPRRKLVWVVPLTKGPILKFDKEKLSVVDMSPIVGCAKHSSETEPECRRYYARPGQWHTALLVYLSEESLEGHILH